MIDTVIFENKAGAKFDADARGLIMKSHVVSPPKPKVHRFALDGMDGELDLTEWTGETRFEPRTVQIGLRDMSSSAYDELIQFVAGRVVKIMFSDDPNYYFSGRCEGIEKSAQNRVTDIDLTFTCEPYRLARQATVKKLTVSGAGSITLKSARKTVVPTIKSTKACRATYAGNTFDLRAATQSIPVVKITDSAQKLSISNVSGSATLTITWTDGVL